MSTEDNKTIARRFHEDVLSQGNLDLIEEICDANWTFYAPNDPQGKNWPRGPQAARQVVTMYRTAFPDLHIAIEDEVAEGEQVMLRWTGRGTHKGDLMGIPPTGKQVAVTGVTINRIRNGKIVEDRLHMDELGMMQQLGVIPGME